MQSAFPLNVCGMYTANGNRCGFFIQRRTWGNTVARVVDIEDHPDGQPLPGTPPYLVDPAALPWAIKLPPYDNG